MDENACDPMVSLSLCPSRCSLNTTSYSSLICHVDIVSCIPHVSFIILSSLLLLVYGCCPSLKREKTPYTLHYPCHYARWILLFVLVLSNVFCILEGVLSDLKSPSPETQPHLYLTGSCGLLAAVLACVFYHHLEAWVRTGFAWLLQTYWVSALIGESFRLATWMAEPDNVDQRIVRFDAIVFTVLVYAALCMLEVFALFLMFWRNSQEKSLPDDLRKPDMKYYMNYVSFPSRLLFSWQRWLFVQGYKRPLEIGDLGCLPEMSTSRFNLKNFEWHLQQEKERADKLGGPAHFSLYRVLLKAFLRWHVAAFIHKVVADVLQFVGPLAVSGIVTYASVLYYDKGETIDELSDFVTVGEFFSNGFVLLVIMGAIGLLRIMILHSNYHLLILSSLHLRAAVQSAIYNKTLRLSGWMVSSGSMTTGQITNLMSVDASHLMAFYQYSQYLYSLPVIIFTLMAMLYYILGVAALIGSLCFLIAVPLQYKLGEIQARMQKDALKISDERLKQTHEMLQGMKLIKLYGWEEMFCRAITLVRHKELKKLTMSAVFYTLTMFISYIIPTMVTLLGFILFIQFTGLSLTPAIAFTTLTIVNQLRAPVRMFSFTMKHAINNHISIGRLNAFFNAKEIHREEGDRSSSVDGADDQKEEGDGMRTDRHALPEVEVKVGRGAGQNGKAKFFKLPSQEDMSGQDPEPDGTDNKQTKDYTVLKSEPEGSPIPRPDIPDNIAVKIEKGNFSWDPESSAGTLLDINLEIPAGQLTMIVGQVGMGKSSLLSAILGEMHTMSGSVHFNGRRRGVAYAAQRAWLLNASLRDNILFGQEFEEQKFQSVVSACSLQPDIDILPAGDQTEIGEKGINLSGGQKQRVSVARAIYSYNDIVILDDPLSALDVHVGSHLFQDGILDLLLGSGRTVILVTHQLQYMKYANKVVVMTDGCISQQGTPAEVWAANPGLQITSKHQAEAHSSSSEAESCDEEAEKERKMLLKLVEEKKKEQEQKVNVTEEEGKLIEKEERNMGSVSWKVLVFFLRAMTHPLACLSLALYVAKQALIIGTDFWLSKWSEVGNQLALDNATEAVKQTTQQYYVSSYTALLISGALMSFIAALSMFIAIMVAAKHLHRGMLGVISKAPMRFFDTTPVGRVLSRFSSDIKVIDATLMYDMLSMLDSTLSVLSAIVINSIVSPVFILVLMPIVICYIMLQRYYITSSRELQRLDSISKSPIYAHFSESLNGLSTIRAYRDEPRFKSYLLDAIDQNTTVFLYAQTCNRWLGVRLDSIGNLCVFLAGLIALIVAVTSDLEPSYVGLALAYSLAASFMLNWFIRQISNIEMEMNAVERIKYYSEIPIENYQGEIPECEWPDHGAVAVEGISVRYAEKLDAVLNNITVNIEPGQKIGICGRTGSGKSSLTLALFRVVDMFKGKILIDSIDIASLPLSHLRQKLSVIPQDPILFSGSIRFNLDPLGKCSEDELWTALDIAQLKATVTDLEAGLDSKVAEGGENFSMGQRQLFCLARAFLRKSRILIMDEATASIDIETDNIVQEVLSKEFSDRTILVIAHRVTTILNADRILVLSEGAVVEYDTPENLLAREDSQFAMFVRNAHQ